MDTTQNTGTLVALAELERARVSASAPFLTVPLAPINPESPWSKAGAMDREKMRLLELLRK